MGFQLIATKVFVFLDASWNHGTLRGGEVCSCLKLGDLTEWKMATKRHGAEYFRKEFVFLLLGLTSPCHPAICGDLCFGFSAK